MPAKITLPPEQIVSSSQMRHKLQLTSHTIPLGPSAAAVHTEIVES